MATNKALNEKEHEPSTMTRPAGSGFGAEEYEELSSIERRENSRSSSKGSSGARGRPNKDQTRYGMSS